MTEYFKGQNWKVHPDFVYCEYNSLKDMDKELENSGDSFFRDREDSFDTPEEQVLHFMSRAGRPGWKWMSVSLKCEKLIKTIFYKKIIHRFSFEREVHNRTIHMVALKRDIFTSNRLRIKTHEKLNLIIAIELCFKVWYVMQWLQNLLARRTCWARERRKISSKCRTVGSLLENFSTGKRLHDLF